MLQARKCLDEITELYQSGPTDMGSDLLNQVVDLYFMTVDKHSAEDRDAFSDVMILLAFSGGGMVRARLAERMCREESAPLELLRRLACDDIITARPILQFSPCLRESDLISIIAQVDQDHMFAAAQRHNISIPVTDLLMQRGTEMVQVAMARNISAQFSPEGRKHLREVAQNCSDLHDALKLRRDMKRAPIIQLKQLADARFWQRMAVSLLMTEVQSVEAATEQLHAPDKDEPRIDPGISKQLSETEVQNVEAAAKALRAPDRDAARVEPAISEQPSEQAVNTDSGVMPSSNISEHELESAAKAGDAKKSVEYFSALAQLSQDMIRHCLFEAHVTALMVLCKAHKMAQGTFISLLLLRENHTGESTNDTVGLMRRYDGMKPETAQRVIRFSSKRPRDENEENEETRESDSQALAS